MTAAGGPGGGMEPPPDGDYRGAFAAAYRAGWRAALDGQGLSDNPYGDYRTRRGSVTFSRAFRRAWARGFKRAIDTRKASD